MGARQPAGSGTLHSIGHEFPQEVVVPFQFGLSDPLLDQSTQPVDQPLHPVLGIEIFPVMGRRC